MLWFLTMAQSCCDMAFVPLDIRYNFNLLQVGGSWSGNVFNGCECITIFSKIRSDALTQQERSRGRMRMWIYVLITLVSTIGLFTFIELTREKPETEFVHDKARIEIPKLHISDISK